MKFGGGHQRIIQRLPYASSVTRSWTGHPTAPDW